MMGYSQDNCCIDSKGEEAHRLQNGYGVVRNKPISSSSSSLIIGENRKEIDFEVVSLLQKMVWELGLRCVLPGAAKVRLQHKNEKKKVVEQESGNEEGSEHNKAWLLAESSAVVVVDNDDAEFTSDPQSVHSSFRFSFGSQIEFDALCLNSSSSGATTTVLMVNLDNGLRESQSKDLKWRRMESLERSISPVADTLTRYSYAEIRSATQNFYKGRVLGRGALSCVFRGRVGFRRTSVAIKRLDKEDKECSKAFVRELMIASSLDNRNIVPLIGFCIDPDEGLFLVYKYVSGGSLEHHLHEKKKGIRGRSSLSCSVRFKIAIGIAEAVAYLHNGTERCVVHRDIKPSNILLSSKKTPKLCDFGLATWTDAPSVPFLCKTVKGTFGYLAPEYFQHGKVSDKTDVYAFGVVLLELITGRKPIETKRESGDENLVLWAKPLLEQGIGAIGKLLDPKLKLRPHNSRQMTRMVEAAAACINSEESRRPSIDEVISILRGEEHNGSSNKNKSSFSGCLTDCYAQSNDLQTKSDLKSHLALAMLGVSDLEDDDHLYSR